jgi:flagellar protein FlbT
MTLRISLRDGEQMIVNGAVLRSIGRTDLNVENNVALLRGREIMAADEATTPARRLYFSCMMAYIDQENAFAHQDGVVRFLGELMAALESHEAKSVCVSFARKVATADYYRALADCRTLIAYEAEVFERATSQAA